METIVSAAVKVRKLDEKEFITAISSNHSSCYDYLHQGYQIYARVWPEKYECIEGFYTNTERFVDREEAFKIAKNANQLLGIVAQEKDIIPLQSYMLKFDS